MCYNDFREGELKMTNATLAVEKYIIELSEKWPTNNQIVHFHHQYEIYCLLEGEVNYFIENEIYHIRVGDIVMISPGTIHQARKIEGVNRKRLLIFLSEFDIKEYLELCPDLITCFKNHVVHFRKTEWARLNLIFNELIIENNSKKPNYAYIKALFVQLLVFISRGINSRDDKYYEANSDKDKMFEIVEYLNLHYNEDLSLEILSKKFGFHKNYISRRFAEIVGMPYLEYLTNLRIRNAMLLLSENRFNITQIAEKTGFKSCNSFCVVFKKTIGVSPLNYRKARQTEAKILQSEAN